MDPEISSYTKERFLEDFNNEECVGNWSFNEYKNVKLGDTFYLMRCGDSDRNGIVMRGEIISECYEDADWSPKGRPNIHYADILDQLTINPWSDAPMLTPELLTKNMPDFNWFGGHSGRRLSDKYAEKLDLILLKYVNSNPQMFAEDYAHLNEWSFPLLTDKMMEGLRDEIPDECEICGYSYEKAYGRDVDMYNYVIPIPSRRLGCLYHTICHSCDVMPQEIIEETLAKKMGK